MTGRRWGDDSGHHAVLHDDPTVVVPPGCLEGRMYNLLSVVPPQGLEP